MKIVRTALLIALLLAAITSNIVQGGSYYTPFVTSIAYQNTGTSTATVTFKFYSENGSLVQTVSKSIAAEAGASLSVGDSALGLPARFRGSIEMSANNNIVGTLVQSPISIKVKNRLLSNTFSTGSPKLLLPTILKNMYSTKSTSNFSIQNVTSSYIDLKVYLYEAANPTTPKVSLTIEDLAPKAAKYFHMDSSDIRDYKINLADLTFNGSAVVEAFYANTSSAASIVGTVVELANTDPLNGSIYIDPNQRYTAIAYEAIKTGATKLYMATALCNSFGTTTTYAVQNVATSGSANVKVTYSDSQQELATIQPGAKYSFNACTVHGSNFSGSAQIESTNSVLIAAIGKAWKAGDPNYTTAFEGVPQGAAKLALPFVRYTSDANYNNGSRQRTFIAIQNVGTANATNVQVKYLNSSGGIVGTHTIATIGPNQKANSSAILATGNAAQLQEFGYPEINLGGVHGGSVIIVAPGSQLIALARVASKDTNTNLDVSEDYMATIVP